MIVFRRKIIVADTQYRLQICLTSVQINEYMVVYSPTESLGIMIGVWLIPVIPVWQKIHMAHGICRNVSLTRHLVVRLPLVERLIQLKMVK